MTSGELVSTAPGPQLLATSELVPDAGLVTTTQHGRQRHYYLNTEVIDQIAGTWIDRFRPDDDN